MTRGTGRVEGRRTKWYEWLLDDFARNLLQRSLVVEVPARSDVSLASRDASGRDAYFSSSKDDGKRRPGIGWSPMAGSESIGRVERSVKRLGESLETTRPRVFVEGLSGDAEEEIT
jgi:hypothetical protein